MKLTEQQRRDIRMVLLDANTDQYFDTYNGTEYYAEKIEAIIN